MRETSKKFMIMAISLITLGYLTGCTTPLAPPLEMTDTKNGIIFGNVQSGVMITEVVLHKYGKTYVAPFISPPRVSVYPNGDFIAENLEPGKYYISSFIADNKRFSFAALKLKPYQRVFIVKPGSLVFAGSYQITGKLVYDRHAKGDEFIVQRVRLPGERDILRRIYDVTEGTGWQRRIDRRLKELRV
ncbi:hypothetical protein [Kaarinaea lacus]